MFGEINIIRGNKLGKDNLVINPFVIIGVSIVSIIVCIALSIPLYFGFLFGIAFTMKELNKSGYSIKELMRINISSILEVKNLCFVIMLIGATTSIWLSSGVVPSIMYYGFLYMEGVNFLFAAFIIMVIVSVFMGTAVGTISTVGIALYGIGIGLGVPIELIVGVLVSGGYVADKISPISGLVNLTMTSVNKNYKEIIKGMLPTLIPLLIITAIIYYIIGLQYKFDDYSQLLYYKNAIYEGFSTSLLLLSLPMIVLVLSILGINSMLTIGIGLLIGSMLSIFLQNMTLIEVIKAILFGYHGNTSSQELNKMLVSGGVVSMIEVILIVISGVTLVKLFEKAGVLIPLMDKFMGGVKSRISLIFRTGILSILLTAITCEQSVSIILPGRILQDKYKEFNLDNTVLARTISDTGTIIAPLMVWNVNSFLIKSILGISANQYAPYAILCYICPVVTMAVAYILYRKNYSLNKKHS